MKENKKEREMEGKKGETEAMLEERGREGQTEINTCTSIRKEEIEGERYVKGVKD